ncbi:MAG: glycosyltransferase family 39 protein, partial [Candidatus Hydrogenedentes bacterium]|nr:glycosyltransferase family 39 protein [Candidatus Hydrogenedentota bacterium]
MSDTSLETLQLEHSESLDVLGNANEPGRVLAAVLLVCLIAFHVGMNVWWLQGDNHTIRTDEEGHMLLARTYYETMFTNEYADLIQRVIAISQIRPGNPAHPPLFHALGAVMIAIFGYSTDTIALTSTVLFVVLLLGCHALVRCFLNPWQSLYAVFVVSFTPMVFASSRYFMTDFASAATVVWAIVALVRSEGFLRPGWTFFFAVLNGLGILFRTITFAYLIAPAILAALIGLVRLFARRKTGQPGDTKLGDWVVNIVMALTVTVGIFAPWYYTNLEPFHSYWANKEIGGRIGPLTSFVPSSDLVTPAVSTPSEAPQSVSIVAPIKAPTHSTEQTLEYALNKVKHPAVAWIRYPVYLANNGLFLTLSILALLGMVLVFLRKQFRTTALLYLYAWIIGSWFFFSVQLRSGTPRYGVPVVPALALFAAFFVLALPGRWFRQGVAVLLGAVLIAQYGNMTVQSLGNVILPVRAPVLTAEARHFIDDGLVLYKDNLTLGFSYSHLGVPQTDNYKERLMEAMLAHEKTLPVREGKYAQYQKLGLRGMPLYEQHYWPGENPYRLASLTPEDMPERRVRLIHMGLEPEHLLSRLSETDYILYQVDAAHPETAKSYEAYFGERGFSPVTSFEVPSFGWVPKTINGVLARQVTGELVPVTAASIPAMNLYDLHELSESADFARLTPALQGLVQSNFKTKLDAIATPFPLNEAVTFMAAEVTKTGDDTFRFRLVFRVDQALDRDWSMFFHG